MKLAEPNRDLWLWLLHDGGAWTAHDLAPRVERAVRDVFWQLTGMARRQLVQKLDPAPGSRRIRYAVTGTCLVPNGLCVAEVQASEDLDAIAPALQTSAIAGLTPSRLTTERTQT